MDEVTCYTCNIRVPADNQVCPFCKKPLVFSPEEVKPEVDIRKLLVPQESFSGIKEFYRQHGKWLKPVLLVLFAVVFFWVGALLLVGPPVEILEDPVFPIKVENVKDGLRVVLIKGTVTNMGEDIRSLSLRSLGVTAEFIWSDGRVEKKRIYPTSFFRGDGTLFHGESGVFEVEVPPKTQKVILWAEIVNLGEDRNFRLPMTHKSPPSKRKR